VFLSDGSMGQCSARKYTRFANVSPDILRFPGIHQNGIRVQERNRILFGSPISGRRVRIHCASTSGKWIRVDMFACELLVQRVEGSAAQILGPFDLDQHCEPFLFRIAIFLRLNDPIPDFLVNGSGLVNRRDPVKPRDAAPR
jgi:hypothetical protein